MKTLTYKLEEVEHLGENLFELTANKVGKKLKDRELSYRDCKITSLFRNENNEICARVRYYFLNKGKEQSFFRIESLFYAATNIN